MLLLMAKMLSVEHSEEWDPGESKSSVVKWILRPAIRDKVGAGWSQFKEPVCSQCNRVSVDC